MKTVSIIIYIMYSYYTVYYKLFTLFCIYFLVLYNNKRKTPKILDIVMDNLLNDAVSVGRV